jgi:hypothetical protein
VTYREAAHWCDELGRREQAALTTASCRLMLTAWAPFVEPEVPAAWRLVDAGVAGASAHELRFREPLLQALAAAVLARAGMPDSAQHVLDRALTASEYVPEVLQIGAGVHLLRRDHDAARALLRRYIDVVGELPPLLAESRRLGSAHALRAALITSRPTSPCSSSSTPAAHRPASPQCPPRMQTRT